LYVLIAAFLGGTGFFYDVGYGQNQSFSLPQTTLKSTATATVGSDKGKANQRWIPIDRRKLGELGRLGELLQELPPTMNQEPMTPLEMSGSDKNDSPFDLSKVDVRSLENQLSNLSPEQRERLKQLAKRFSESQKIKELTPSVKDLPPALVDQIRNSQALREFAKDLLDGEVLDENDKESLGISFETQDTEPWIRFDPSNSSLRPRDDDATTSQDPVNANDGTQPATALDSKPVENSSVSRQSDTVGRSSQDVSVDSRTRSSEPIRNRSKQASDWEPGRSKPSSNRQPQVSGSRSPQTPQRSQMNRPSASQSSTSPQPQNETAFDSFRRRVAELGLGQTLERLTKEAVGIEQKRAANPEVINNSSKNESQIEKRGTDDNQASKKGGSFSRSKQDSADRSNAPSSRFASKAEVSDAESTRPSRNVQSPSRTDPMAVPPSTAPSQPNMASENFLLDWRAPSWDDLPSFSFLHIGGILLLVCIIIGILLLNRAPEISRAAQQRKDERALRVSLMQMEISNREQVVRAFDMVASQKVRAFEDWWTAQRVVTHATEQNMDISPKLQTAAVVYNQARYSPPDRRLSDEELSAVRDAIRDCVETRSLG
jgi:hypothetical protein